MRVNIVVVFILALISSQDLKAQSSDFFEKRNWVNQIRKDHPRLFLNSDMLPKLRAHAQGDLKSLFSELVSEVNAFPNDAPVILKRELFEEMSDGKIVLKNASEEGQALFKYNGAEQAVKLAYVFLITKDSKYLSKAKSYIHLANHVFTWTAEKGVWVDLDGRTRIWTLAAIDWIFNELDEGEKKSFLLPVLDYITKAQPQGEYTFRRSFGSAKDGNYGEPSLQWFAGLVSYNAGVDDISAEYMLRSGATLFADMMNYREEVSAGSGLLSSATVGYSFGLYPFSTFNFLHTTRSALNIDFTTVWQQMLDYSKWFDFSAIKILPSGKMLHHGIGDAYHSDNLEDATIVYTHIAQTIHFYSEKYPEKAKAAYRLLNDIAGNLKKIDQYRFPFLPFLLFNFDKSKISEYQWGDVVDDEYFYNSSFGLLLMRSGKGENDTYASFRFGAKEVTHQHYDELSFVLHKKDFLALDAGSRTSTDHHHNFAPQSVAHNTILIHHPNESMPVFWKAWEHVPDGITYYNHGGQYVLNKAKAIALQSSKDFIYAAGDATQSYSDVKSGEVIRQFVYLKPDVFVIYDRVTSKSKDQKKEVLFHFQNEPYRIESNKWGTDREGSLFVTTLLPQKPHFELVGGKGREFEASGRNWELPGAGGRSWDQVYKQTGKWRLEVSDEKDDKHTAFLHILQTALSSNSEQIVSSFNQTEKLDIVYLEDNNGNKWELGFNRSGEVGLKIKQVNADNNEVFNGDLPNIVEGLLSEPIVEPIAVNDKVYLSVGEFIHIDVLKNDIMGNLPLNISTFKIVDQVQHGTLTVNQDGTVTYIVNPNYIGKDGFSYMVQDEGGNWSNIANVEITVGGLIIPNAITPNGDGINDRFEISGVVQNGKGRLHLNIYDEMGNQVYQRKDYDNSWDGEGLKEGTYFYRITLDENGEDKIYKGWLLLKR